MKDKNNQDQNKKNTLFKIGKFNLSSINLWVIVAIYSAIVLTLKYKFDSKIADYLYTISFFAAILFVIYTVYIVLREIVSYIKYKYLK